MLTEHGTNTEPHNVSTINYESTTESSCFSTCKDEFTQKGVAAELVLTLTYAV